MKCYRTTDKGICKSSKLVDAEQPHHSSIFAQQGWVRVQCLECLQINYFKKTAWNRAKEKAAS